MKRFILFALTMTLLSAPAHAATDASAEAAASQPGSQSKIDASPDARIKSVTGGNVRETTPNPLAANPEAKQTWWQALLNDVAKVALDIGILTLGLLILWLLRKLGLKVDVETMDSLAEKARNYAEHKADLWLKEKGEKSDGAQKEEWAWEFVEAIDRKLGARAKAKAKLRAMLLAKIGEYDEDKRLTAGDNAELK